jgi:acetyltransferase EpsM
MKKGAGENIIIIGGVGTARNIIEQILDAKNNHSFNIHLIGIIIDSFEKGSIISGVPVVGNKEDIPVILNDKSIKFLFALFKPEKMKERYHLMGTLNIPLERYASFIHPLAYMSGSVRMGMGNIVLSNSTIQSNVILGNMNIISSNVTIEHETGIGNGNFLAANSCIGSNVKIGNHCFIGLNSSVRENVILKEEVFVGMHSLVLDDFDKCMVAGVPAKRLK